MRALSESLCRNSISLDRIVDLVDRLTSRLEFSRNEERVEVRLERVREAVRSVRKGSKFEHVLDFVLPLFLTM